MPPRPLLPMARLSDEGSADEHRRNLGAGDANLLLVKPKRKVIAAACDTCRQRKSKCDGVRPICSACGTRRTSCRYDVEAGETRVQSLKSKKQDLEKALSAMEEVYSTLQTGSLEEISTAIQRIRRDGASVFSPHLALQTGDRAVEGTGAAYTVLLASNPRHIQMLPDRNAAFAAVEDFYRCAPMFLHVFPYDLALSALREAYDAVEGPSPPLLAEVLSLVAVGFQYAHNKESSSLGRESYQAARLFLEDALEADRLRALRVVAYLALFNIFGKNLVALSYIELALSISRRYGLHEHRHPPDVEPRAWREMKDVWRSLVFLETWVTASIGYVSDAQVEEWSRELLEQDTSVGEILGTISVAEVVQAEMAKVLILTSRLVRALYAPPQLDMRVVSAARAHLRTWYEALPGELNIRRQLHDDASYPQIVLVSVYFAHLIYQAAIMMLYRRVLFSDTRRADVIDILSGSEAFRQASSYVEDGLAAARSTAALLDSMFQAGLLYKQCWLVIYFSFTSAVILLSDVAQQRLGHRKGGRGQDGQEARSSQDLGLVDDCLRVLSWAAEIDAAAGHLREVIFPYRQFLAPPPASAAESSARGVKATAALQSEQLPAVAQELLNLVRNPFDEAETNGIPFDPLLRFSLQRQAPLAGAGPHEAASVPASAAAAAAGPSWLGWTSGESSVEGPPSSQEDRSSRGSPNKRRCTIESLVNH